MDYVHHKAASGLRSSGPCAGLAAVDTQEVEEKRENVSRKSKYVSYLKLDA